jgi:hypothetical protein
MTKGFRIATAATTVLVLVLVAYTVLRESAENELTVVNQSGVALKSLEVALPWETLRFDSLDSGATQTRSFAIKHDAHFEIRGELADGTSVHASDGYITHGQYREAVHIEVGRGGAIKLRQGPRAT